MDTDKLSVAECKKILSKKGKTYTDNEIISIRDLLYCFAQVDIETFHHLNDKEKVAQENDSENKTITVSTNSNNLMDAA